MQDLIAGAALVVVALPMCAVLFAYIGDGRGKRGLNWQEDKMTWLLILVSLLLLVVTVIGVLIYALIHGPDVNLPGGPHIPD